MAADSPTCLLLKSDGGHVYVDAPASISRTARTRLGLPLSASLFA